MRLLLFNLATDEADPLLGFACGWIARLAQHCDSIDVLTMKRGAYTLPGNVRVFSAGRERGLSKPVRLAIFYRHLLHLLATRRYDACFAHMMPLFAGLGGPLLRARGIPITLWYTHRQRSRQLRLGQASAWRVVSAHESSYPYETDKLRALGHGIDTDFYAPGDRAALDESRLVVQVARLAAIKHQASVIEAIAGTKATLALVGGLQAGAPDAYEAELKQLVDARGLKAQCQFVGNQTRDQVLGWYRRAAVAVNMSPPGLFDKAALEGMACGLPTIVANPAFAPLLGARRDLLLVDSPGDSRGLHERLLRLSQLSASERADIGAMLRDNVQRQHSLPRLVEGLMSVLRTGELPT